ncbi:MAG: Bro-N domain-containing protein, partial [Candidatus Competibacter denitrificans]
MTAQVVPLVFQQKNSVRVILINNEPWFVATDIAVVLEYSEAAKLTRMLEADEKGLHNVETPGGNQQLSIISQPGLFRALANSRSSKAKPFQRWLFHEALPAIYSTGRYEVPQPDPDPTPTLSLEQWRVISDLIHRISICCKFHGRANSAAHERIR